MTFVLGTRVRKIEGASWRGRVCGHYSTSLTPYGVCVESDNEPGSVQTYPVSALESVAGVDDGGAQTKPVDDPTTRAARAEARVAELEAALAALDVLTERLSAIPTNQ